MTTDLVSLKEDLRAIIALTADSADRWIYERTLAAIEALERERVEDQDRAARLAGWLEEQTAYAGNLEAKLAHLADRPLGCLQYAQEGKCQQATCDCGYTEWWIRLNEINAALSKNPVIIGIDKGKPGGDQTAEVEAHVEGGRIVVDKITTHEAGKEGENNDALKDMEARKDAAYEERNRVVAALAWMCVWAGWKVGTARTAIEGWSEDWHGCVYIDFPHGQASWHYHDSHAHLFRELPAYRGSWDGHTTLEKYERVAYLSEVLASQRVPSAPQVNVEGNGR